MGAIWGQNSFGATFIVSRWLQIHSKGGFSTADHAPRSRCYELKKFGPVKPFQHQTGSASSEDLHSKSNDLTLSLPCRQKSTGSVLLIRVLKLVSKRQLERSAPGDLDSLERPASNQNSPAAKLLTSREIRFHGRNNCSVVTQQTQRRSTLE